MSFESGWERLMKALVLHRSEAAPDFVWHNIKHHLASSLHSTQSISSETVDLENKLRAIAHAESQTPPAFVWNNIENSLSLDNFGHALPHESYWRNLSQAVSIKPSNDIWNNIDSQLHPERKRRPIALIFFLIGALLFSVGLSYYLSHKDVDAEVLKVKSKTNFAKASANATLLNKSNAANEENTSLNATTQNQSQNTLMHGNVGLLTKFSNHGINTRSESPNGPLNDSENLKIEESSEAKERRTGISFPHLPRSLALLSKSKTKLVLPKIECPDFSNRHKPSFFIEANILGGAHDRSFDAFGVEQSPLATLRKNAEHTAYSVGGSFIAGFYMNRNIYFGTGLAYTRSRDNFKTEGISRQIINYDPVTGIPIDTIYETKVINHEILYTNLDLPILMGYEHFAYGWAFGLEVGALLNLKTSNNGFTYNKSLIISSIASQGDVIKTKLGLGVTGSFILRKYLTPNLSIHLKPGFKTYLNDWNDNTYPVKIKSNLYYVNLGVRHVF